MDLNQIITGEALAEMQKLPDNSIDLIYTDPPYFKVKGEAWDRLWETPEGFTRGEDDDAPSEFYSQDEVVPTKIIQVEPEDFPYPIVQIDTDQEFRHFHKSLFVGFAEGDIREVVLPLCGSKIKKLRCRIREMGVSEIKEFLKKNRGRKLNDIDYLNSSLIGFKFVDDVHGIKPDYTKKELPISLLLKEVYDDLIDAAYPLPKIGDR